MESISWPLNARTEAGLIQFWDSEAPDTSSYWAIQRECHNAATLEMIRDAIDSQDPCNPIRLIKEREGVGKARWNLRCFSTEGPQYQHLLKGGVEMSPENVPRLRKCYGWLKLGGDVLNAWGALPIKVGKTHREFLAGHEYFAILYEYIEEGEVDKGQMQTALDFYYRAGFQYATAPLWSNWKSGVLIDNCDIITPYTYGYNSRSQKPLTVDQLL